MVHTKEIPSCFFACMFDPELLAAHQDEYPNCPECSWTRMSAETEAAESAEIVHDETEAAESAEIMHDETEAAEAEAAESEAVKTVPAAPAPAQMQREIPSCFFACMFDPELLAAHQDEYPNCPECSWTRMSAETEGGET